MEEGTTFTQLVGCELPLQLASLGGPIGTPALAAAVSEAGGLGMIPNPASADEVRDQMERARALTSRPIGIGFLVPFVDRDAVAAAAATSEVVEFFYGDPDRDLVAAAKRDGAVAGWQVGSADEARAAERAGCDFVVAQGIEAGGHVRGRQPLEAVLAETLAGVDVPVVGAGGIGTPERAAEVLRAGASAVRLGTRFVAAEEADAHATYVQRLIAASAGDTVLGEPFSTGWPDAPHRVLRGAVEAAERVETPTVGTANEREIPRFAALPPTKITQGAVGAMALYAGESVDAVTRVAPAAEIVAELATGMARG